MSDENEFEPPLYAFTMAYRPNNITTIFVTEDMMLAIMTFQDKYGVEPDAVALIGEVEHIERYADSGENEFEKGPVLN